MTLNYRAQLSVENYENKYVLALGLLIANIQHSFNLFSYLEHNVLRQAANTLLLGKTNKTKNLILAVSSQVFPNQMGLKQQATLV